MASHVGLVRARNEDHFCVWEAPERPGCALLAVADGMGGHRAGEVASALALETICSHVGKTLVPVRAGGEEAAAGEAAATLDLGHLLLEGIRVANRRVYHRARRRPEWKGMGTTVTALLITGDEMCVGHVGDSRAYLLRGDKMAHLTVDHSLVGEMVHEGGLTEAEAMSHPQRHLLTRALGIARETQADISRSTVREGDVLILATDGLTNLVSAEEIMSVIRDGGGEFSLLAQKLVEMANQRGGHDNATVIVAAV